MCFKNDRELYKRYTPPRRKLVIVVPLLMLAAVIFSCSAMLFVVLGEGRAWTLVSGIACVLLGVASIVWLVLAWRKCNRDEFALSKQKYAYLWKKEFAPAEEFETVDADTGITYTVKREGLKVVFPLPEGYEQVFDEVAENEDFIPWTRTRLALATCNTYFTARLALAVLDMGTAQMEEDGEASYEEPFILPLSEDLVRAVRSFDLEDKTCENWVYLFYNPDDALYQVQKRGYIRVMRDRKTGKKIPLEDKEN